MPCLLVTSLHSSILSHLQPDPTMKRWVMLSLTHASVNEFGETFKLVIFLPFESNFAKFIAYQGLPLYVNTLFVLQLKQVEEYMRYRKLPSPLKLKVHDYYYHRYHGHLFNEEQILKELSHALKEVTRPLRHTISQRLRASSHYHNHDTVFSPYCINFTEYCELQLS